MRCVQFCVVVAVVLRAACSECFSNTLSMPDLVPHLRVLVSTINERTRLMTEVEFDAKSD